MRPILSQRPSVSYRSAISNSGRQGFLIASHYLPPDAPELHPDAYVNGDRNVQVAPRAPVRDRAELEQTATRRLRSFPRRPECVKKVFPHPRVQYAA